MRSAVTTNFVKERRTRNSRSRNADESHISKQASLFSPYALELTVPSSAENASLVVSVGFLSWVSGSEEEREGLEQDDLVRSKPVVFCKSHYHRGRCLVQDRHEHDDSTPSSTDPVCRYDPRAVDSAALHRQIPCRTRVVCKDVGALERHKSPSTRRRLCGRYQDRLGNIQVFGERRLTVVVSRPCLSLSTVGVDNPNNRRFCMREPMLPRVPRLSE
jgi:hypothetical protein